MKFKKTVLTSKGKDLMTYALNGYGLQFTRMVLSSQNIRDEELENLSTLSEQMSETVQAIGKFDNDTVILKSTYTNEFLDYNFYVSAIGIYAKTDVTSEILFGVALTYPDNKDYMPSKYEKEFTMYVDMFLSMGNAEIVIKEDIVEKQRQEKYIESLMDRSVEAINFPNDLKSLGPYAFASCNNIKSVELPEHITELAKCLFYECNKLKEVKFSENVTKISEGAFQNCNELLTVTLHDQITDIEGTAFQNCKKLNITKLPSELTSIGSMGLYHCEAISGQLIIPQKVKIIEGYGLAYCNFESVVFKGKPSTIVNTVFTGCNKLNKIYVPWSEGEVANAPWSAKNATIIYNYTGE